MTANGPDTPAPKGTLAQRLTDLPLSGAIRGAMALPYERRVPFMGAVVRRALGPLAGYRRRALDNLALVRPDWPAARRRAVADECLDNFGRTLIELYSHEDLRRRLRGAPLGGGGLPHLERAAADGRPVIFVTGHFGNHEAARYVLVERGYAIGGLYREMDNPYTNAHYVRAATAVSGPGFAKGRRGVLGFVRHLRGGGMATILFDLRESSGVAIPFLGRPALTATTAADLALRLDALVLPYFATRRPDGLGFDAVLEEPIPHGDPVAMMREMNARLEARVAAHPGQWFWVHRRWRLTSGADRSGVSGSGRAPPP